MRRRRRYLTNPFFSPPAMQYVARAGMGFLMNPEGSEQASTPYGSCWGCGRPKPHPDSPDTCPDCRAYAGNPHSGPYSGYAFWSDLKDEVFAMTPDSAEGIADSLGISVDDVHKALGELVAEGQAVERDGEYYSADFPYGTNPCGARHNPALSPALARWTMKKAGRAYGEHSPRLSGWARDMPRERLEMMWHQLPEHEQAAIMAAYDATPETNPFFSPPAMQYVARAGMGMLMNPHTSDKHAAKRYMRLHAQDHVDPYTGEINYTGLAENTAWELNHDEWLDDETHWIWDIAIDVGDGYVRARGNPPFSLPPNVPIQYPSGRWGFAGRVDTRLAWTKPDGSPADPKDVETARQFGPGMLIKMGRLKRRTWATQEAAEAAARGRTNPRRRRRRNPRVQVGQAGIGGPGTIKVTAFQPSGPSGNRSGVLTTKRGGQYHTAYWWTTGANGNYGDAKTSRHLSEARRAHAEMVRHWEETQGRVADNIYSSQWSENPPNYYGPCPGDQVTVRGRRARIQDVSRHPHHYSKTPHQPKYIHVVYEDGVYDTIPAAVPMELHRRGAPGAYQGGDVLESVTLSNPAEPHLRAMVGNLCDQYAQMYGSAVQGELYVGLRGGTKLARDKARERGGPFRAPHHTAGARAMVEETGMAAGGLLMLDEADSFRKHVLQLIHQELLGMDPSDRPYVFVTVKDQDGIARLPGWIQSLPISALENPYGMRRYR